MYSKQFVQIQCIICTLCNRKNNPLNLKFRKYQHSDSWFVTLMFDVIRHMHLVEVKVIPRLIAIFFLSIV